VSGALARASCPCRSLRSTTPCRWYGMSGAGGSYPAPTSKRMCCTPAGCVCGWILPFWRAPSGCMHSTAVPGRFLPHGKTSAFRSPAASSRASALDFAHHPDRCGGQRCVVACLVGVVDRQCIALRPAVRRAAGAERHFCFGDALQGGGGGAGTSVLG